MPLGRMGVDIWLLAMCFCFGMSSVFGSVSVLSLVVAERYGTSFALLPLSVQRLVATLWTFRAARYKNRLGFVSAGLTGAAGFLVVAVALIFFGDGPFSLAIFVLGFVLQGFSEPYIQFLRFTAAELSSDEWKGHSISLVIAGGAVAAVLGPGMASYTAGAIPGARYSGCFILCGFLMLCNASTITLVRFAPAPRSGSNPDSTLQGKVIQPPRPLLEILSQVPYFAAAVTSTVLYATMVSPMAISPLVMAGKGFTLAESTTVIHSTS